MHNFVSSNESISLSAIQNKEEHVDQNGSKKSHQLPPYIPKHLVEYSRHAQIQSFIAYPLFDFK